MKSLKSRAALCVGLLCLCAVGLWAYYGRPPHQEVQRKTIEGFQITRANLEETGDGLLVLRGQLSNGTRTDYKGLRMHVGVWGQDQSLIGGVIVPIESVAARTTVPFEVPVPSKTVKITMDGIGP